ncbi:MAG: AAA family ATPase [Steroidobacteraceae bacterium]
MAAPFLERTQPLARLEAAFASARERRGRLVSIEGEAGIGKTTLSLRFAQAHARDSQLHQGGCENLSTPEPLGPLRDIARESDGRFAVTPSSPLATFESLLRLLSPAGGRPSLLLIEDLHWADDSTLDLLRYLGRRIRTAPILVVVTFRNDEPASQGRLAALWDDVPRDVRERIELQRLTPAAVEQLAEGVPQALSKGLYAATGGNPFHVTEYLAAKPPEVPRSVREASLARASRLSPQARRVLDAASLFPRHVDERLLSLVVEDAEQAGLEECLRSGMLNASDGRLSFRHELARRAIHEAMASLRRRALHADALARLESGDVISAAQAAHHAGEAGDAAALLKHSLRAAEEARGLGGYRESVEHLGRALAQPDVDGDARARLLEQQADDAERCGLLDLANRAIDEAIELHRRAGRALGIGNALRIGARLAWLNGDVVLAEQRTGESLQVLEGHRDSWQYAMALSGQSQLDMLAERNTLARERASEAMERADRIGRSDIYMHALTNLRAISGDFDYATNRAELLAAIDEGRRRGMLDMLPRLYVNFTYMMMCARRYEDLFDHLEVGIATANAREHLPLGAYMRGVRALALLDLGRNQEALAEAEEVAGGPYPRGVTRYTSLVALARARIRLGLPHEDVHQEMWELPMSRRDIMRFAPLANVDAEAAWLAGAPVAAEVIERLRAAFDLACRTDGQPWTVSDTAFWLVTLQQPCEIPTALRNRLHPPMQAMIDGNWSAAAEGWQAMGCGYEQAIALSRGDESQQRAALKLFDALGAAPAAARLRRELRSGGVRDLPRGPNSATRSNALGLTGRQQQVLELLIQGLPNSAIAKRLAIAPKTTEHHVSAVLALLGARTRTEAIAVARERGLGGSLEN